MKCEVVRLNTPAPLRRYTVQGEPGKSRIFAVGATAFLLATHNDGETAVITSKHGGHLYYGEVLPIVIKRSDRLDDIPDHIAKRVGELVERDKQPPPVVLGPLAPEAMKVMVIGDNNGWGKGDTIKEARDNVRKAMGSYPKQYLVYIVHPSSTVDEVSGGVVYPRGFPPKLILSPKKPAEKKARK